MKNTTSKFIGTNQHSNKTFSERFWEKVDIRGEDECWEWQGSRHYVWKYGHFKVGKSSVAAHRVSWELHNNAKIEKGLVVCHKCDNPPCCNPNHLFVGTVADNNLDKKKKGRTPDGHGENNNRSVLKSSDVLEMRKLHTNGEKYTTLAKKYGITPTHARSICINAAWTHLSSEVA